MTVPRRIIKTYEPGGLHMLTVDDRGVSREICLIHEDCEVSVWNEDEVLETPDLLKQIGSIEEEF